MESVKPSDFIPKPKSYEYDDEYLKNIESTESVVEDVRIIRREFYLYASPDSSHPSHEVIEFIPEIENFDSTPIVFMQGFMATANDYESSLATMAKEKERRVIAWNEIAGVQIGNDVRYEDEKGIPDIQLSKVLAMDALMKEMHIEKADIVAHSEGCINALTLEMLGHRISNMLLLSPAGITNNKNIFSLGLAGMKDGYLRKIWDGKYGTPGDYMATGYRQKGNLLEKIYHVYQSLKGMTQGDVVHRLMQEISFDAISRQDNEPHVIIIAAKRDNLFAADEMADRYSDIFSQLAIVDDFLIVEGVDHPGILVDSVFFSKHILPYVD